ncbi:MAG: sulfur carrier protein ThiS [Hydrogenophaga sp.]|uniref:Sulfur carrier protein ThiS n=1 Tax=Hydrogenophaga crocea TaxID=2716225 RepID=A0A6G8ICX2_9BURK|nr:MULTISPECIES: sulfur carrier protein ThiS [Hydrogenophaga]MBL0945160.1 sulfur carrier protein ThiS [Hydrogenophaga sp.]QIM50850.1 sulfur carrier protein ThiS [Hydrogenophaga crocea]
MTPPPPEATVHFNDHPLPCPEGLTLAALLEQQGVNPARVATALNARFVPREARAQTPLRAGDVVVTFEAIVGG